MSEPFDQDFVFWCGSAFCGLLTFARDFVRAERDGYCGNRDPLWMLYRTTSFLDWLLKHHEHTLADMIGEPESWDEEDPLVNYRLFEAAVAMHSKGLQPAELAERRESLKRAAFALVERGGDLAA